jgi:hypothetical protein
MSNTIRLSILASAALLSVALPASVQAQQATWNASHPSRGSDGGCSQADLRSTGGAGLFYCFAVN